MAALLSTKLVRRIRKKIIRTVLVRGKRIQQSFLPSSASPKDTLFIVGCQRSGTTMMLRMFERDRLSRVYGEFSELSSRDANKIRLNPLPLVKKQLAQDPAPFAVLKPMVETQNIVTLLDYFPGSKALWIYRHYQDVAASNLKNFGEENGISDLRPIVERHPGNWRSEHVPEDVRITVSQYFSEDMSNIDAAALFWYVRNRLYFDLYLEKDARVMICRYDNIVKNPRSKMQEVYDFLGRPFPEAVVMKDVNTASIGKGRNNVISAEIQTLCEGLLERLDDARLS